ncbi:MAG: phage major tail tube protein [Betaproteobacteria bacterium]
MTQIRKITNVAVWLDNDDCLGQAEEITLPNITTKTVEHNALGMSGVLELPAGLDKMEMNIKWNSFYPSALPKLANPYAAFQIQVRGSLETFTSAGRAAQVSYLFKATVMPKELMGGDFKQHERAGTESNFSVSMAELIIDGVQMYKINILTNEHRVGGVDVLANYRRNLGF